jgi:putative cell wall-binding protein
VPLRSRVLPVVLLVLPLVVAMPGAASGQAPVTATFDEPAEYGLDDRHDPFDYTQSTDLMTERDVTKGVVHKSAAADGLTTFRANGVQGLWYVSPVWMTFPHHVDENADPSELPDADGGALHDQHDGLAEPIDANRYSHVSMRFFVQGDPGLMYLSWFACQEWLAQCEGIMELDVQPGWNTVNVRVSNNVPYSGRNREWRGEVYGMRLQGAIDDPITVSLDWFRLYDGGSEHDITVTARSNGPLTFSENPTTTQPQSVTTDETWGYLRAREASLDTMRVNVGGLPPGTWYVQDEDGETAAEVTVRARPRVEVLDPDAAGGADYATEVLGNPWDFEDKADAKAIGNARNVSWSGGELSAVNTSNDPWVRLPLGPDGLDPVHYHRVTVDQHYASDFNLDDGPGDGNPMPGGSHGRLLWRTPRHPSNSAECAHFSDGREFVFYKTWDRYIYDMRDVPAAQGMSSSAEPNIGADYCTVTGPDPHWTANGNLGFLRFDPHEAPTQYRWYVDELRIAADDAADPTFDVTWTDHAFGDGIVSEGASTRVVVRLDDDRSGYDGEVLYDGPQTSGKQSVTFDATDRLPGAYWVNVTATTPDGRTSRDYATGPLQVAPRIKGGDRVETAVEVSRQTFDGARTAVIASARDFPDALVAVQLADAVKGPVLLTEPGRLDGRVAGELERLGVDEVVIAGGTVAVGDRVERQLGNRVDRVQRISGPTRYETAAAIAREALERRGRSGADRVLVTTGENFPDALAAGPYVGHADLPLVLARPAVQPPPGPDGETPPPDVTQGNDAARRFLADVGADRVTVLGGGAALSAPVVDHVVSGRSHDRIAGGDRFDTARKLTQAAVGAGASAGDVLVATGRNYPDALSAGPAALARGGVLALTEKDGVPAPTRSWLAGVDDWSSWRVVGGHVAVSHATVRSLRGASGL